MFSYWLKRSYSIKLANVTSTLNLICLYINGKGIELNAY